MRTDEKNGVTEVGHVHFSPLLSGTVMSTEAHWLLMKYVFDTLGYRRYEWKCDSLNAPSAMRHCAWVFSMKAVSVRRGLSKAAPVTPNGFPLLTVNGRWLTTPWNSGCQRVISHRTVNRSAPGIPA